MPLMFIHWR